MMAIYEGMMMVLGRMKQTENTIQQKARLLGSVASRSTVLV